jgi:hypothetical protein
VNFIIYSGPERDVKVYLYKNGNHFDTINNMTGFYGQSYYCEIVIYGTSGLLKIPPTRGICNLRGLARVGYYLKWVTPNNPRMPYNVLSNIPKIFR